jgi:hypothetical protein
MKPQDVISPDLAAANPALSAIIAELLQPSAPINLEEAADRVPAEPRFLGPEAWVNILRKSATAPKP